MVLYLLAFSQAQQQQYAEAIATLAQIPADSKWANSRKKLTKTWTEKQAEKEKALHTPVIP